MIDNRFYWYKEDTERAAVVRIIFSWAGEGAGGRVIAGRLSEMGTELLY
jgi:hypothetical protein